MVVGKSDTGQVFLIFPGGEDDTWPYPSDSYSANIELLRSRTDGTFVLVKKFFLFQIQT